MKVKILYFAVLRDQAGIASETLEFDGTTPSQIYQELVSLGRVSLPVNLVRPAVNGKFADMGHELAENDEVVFVPPVAGG